MPPLEARSGMASLPHISPANHSYSGVEDPVATLETLEKLCLSVWQFNIIEVFTQASCS